MLGTPWFRESLALYGVGFQSPSENCVLLPCQPTVLLISLLSNQATLELCFIPFFLFSAAACSLRSSSTITFMKKLLSPATY